MGRTYVPGAVTIAEKAHRYLTRYQSTLTIGATTEQLAALADLVACLAAFLTRWTKPPIQP